MVLQQDDQDHHTVYSPVTQISGMKNYVFTSMTNLTNTISNDIEEEEEDLKLASMTTIVITLNEENEDDYSLGTQNSDVHNFVLDSSEPIELYKISKIIQNLQKTMKSPNLDNSLRLQNTDTIVCSTKTNGKCFKEFNATEIIDILKCRHMCKE